MSKEMFEDVPFIDPKTGTLNVVEETSEDETEDDFTGEDVVVSDYNKNHYGPGEKGGQFAPSGQEWSNASSASSRTASEKATKTTGGKLSHLERTAVKAYTGSDYQSWNKCLRKSNADFCAAKYSYSDDFFSEKRGGGLGDLVSVINRSRLRKDMVLYRGMRTTPALSADGLRKAMRRGRKVTIPGFFSTTNKREVASNFADLESNSTTFEIYARKGLPGYGVTKGESGPEGEVILPHNSQFRVESVLTDYKKKYTVVRLHYLGARL